MAKTDIKDFDGTEAEFLEENAEYWEDRLLKINTSGYEDAAEFYEEIEEAYKVAEIEIRKDIEDFYQKFADENGIVDLTEAKKILTKGELDEFRWTVERYVQECKNLSDASQEWSQEVLNASYRYRISRLEALETQIGYQLTLLADKTDTGLNEVLTEIFSSNYYHTAFEVQGAMGLYADFHTLPNESIVKTINKIWGIDGSNFSDRIWTNKEKLETTLHKTLTRQFATGDSMDKAIKTVAKQMNTEKWKAGRLISTETAHLQNEAQNECYQELGIEEYQYSCTLDSRTCEICGGLDRKVFKMSEKEEGVNFPVMHPNCRCATLPFTGRLEGKRIGRDADDKRIYVDKNMTYEEWAKEYLKDKPKKSKNNKK